MILFILEKIIYNKKMKKYITLVYLIINNYCFAQHFDYTYDQSGNRIERKFSVPRLANPESAIVEKKLGVSAYPNPTNDKINISISSLDNGESADIYLSDEQGKIIFIKKQNSNIEEVDLSSLKAGIYYIRVHIKSEDVSYKIVKF